MITSTYFKYWNDVEVSTMLQPSPINTFRAEAVNNAQQFSILNSLVSCKSWMLWLLDAFSTVDAAFGHLSIYSKLPCYELLPRV